MAAMMPYCHQIPGEHYYVTFSMAGYAPEPWRGPGDVHKGRTIPKEKKAFTVISLSTRTYHNLSQPTGLFLAILLSGFWVAWLPMPSSVVRISHSHRKLPSYAIYISHPQRDRSPHKSLRRIIIRKSLALPRDNEVWRTARESSCYRDE